jgi:hypothetical protein
MEIGLDKLTLTTQDFKVINWGDKMWKQDQRQGEGKNQYEPQKDHLLLIDRCGDECHHKKLYFNPIQEQKFGASNVNITISQKGLVMVLNPSKFERDPRTHIHPVDDHHILTERLEHTMNWVQKHLVDFDDQELNIYRLDMCRNIRTEAPVGMYANRLAPVLEMSRCNTHQHPTGLTTLNNSRKLILYDKVSEITQHKDHKADKAFCSDMVNNWGNTLMRAEIQILKPESVERYWKIHKLGHLHQIGLPTLQDQYKKYMTERLFKTKPMETGFIHFPDGVQLIKDFQNQRDWFHKLVSVCSGLDGIEQTYGSLTTFKWSVRQAMEGKTDVTIRQNMKRLNDNIRKLVKQSAQLKKGQNGISQMYDELQRKICA